ncbi:hypothetical protein EON82_06845 [bacterium]|nr:MAG: hypothetical protein EON82_06845 [bacterium]
MPKPPFDGIVRERRAVKAAMSMLLPILVGQAIVGGQGPASPGSSELAGYYNPRREITFSGVVSGKTKGKTPGFAEGMSIMVKTGRNQREVELGPTWYVGRQSAAINLGDRVKVTGVPLRVGRQQVILARRIMRGRNILALRDASGLPYWNARRTTRVAVTGNGAAQQLNNRFEGTISSSNTFMVDGEQYAGYVVDTANGPMNFAVAPTWYWRNQPTTLRIGDTVTLFGNGGATRIGNVTLVNSIGYNGGTIVLRNNGVPVYGGFYRGG